MSDELKNAKALFFDLQVEKAKLEGRMNETLQVIQRLEQMAAGANEKKEDAEIPEALRR